MALEIERKFLVANDDYKKESFRAIRVTQGYISSVKGRTVRVRTMDDKGFLTIKGPSNANGTTRFEWEKEISVEDVKELLQLCEPGIIDKTRYLIKAGNYTYEVDEFYGDNEGLVVAEIELPQEDAPFKRAAWLGKEVTGDRRYYNASLTKDPYKNWR